MLRPRAFAAVAAILLGAAAAVLAVLRLGCDRGQALALLGAAVVLMVVASVLGGAGRSAASGDAAARRREP